MNDCIYSCSNDTSKPELSLQVRTRNLECLGSNSHALRAWVWGLIAPKLARKTCQLTSRIDPRHKQTRLATVKVLKYKLPQEFNMIPNVQLMTKSPAENTPRKKSYFLEKNCDGQNGHSMKLPVKTAPHYTPNKMPTFVYSSGTRCGGLPVIQKAFRWPDVITIVIPITISTTIFKSLISSTTLWLYFSLCHIFYGRLWCMFDSWTLIAK